MWCFSWMMHRYYEKILPKQPKIYFTHVNCFYSVSVLNTMHLRKIPLPSFTCGCLIYLIYSIDLCCILLQQQQQLLLLLFNKTLNFHNNFSPYMIFRWNHQLITVRVKRDEETDLISTLRIHFVHFVRTELKKKTSNNFIWQLPMFSAVVPNSVSQKTIGTLWLIQFT